jgi:ABC-type polysaccharide/polyol phosphate export permease
VVQGYRDAMVSGAFTWQGVGITLYFWIFVAVFFMLGVLAYRRMRMHLADVI